MKYGRYEIVEELGRGTMGVVYKAHDPQIDRLVALKVLREDRVVSQEFVVRFLREAKAIGRISHPGIVTVYDVGQDHGTIFIAMEYLAGRPLSDVIKDGTYSMDAAGDMCVQVAEALDFAHGRGITHRDIKPSNIILTPEGKIKLTDFGIARIEDPDAAQQTQAGDILGTPVYMAPEQVMGKKADGRTDLYALGVIAYEMTAGKRPFAGGNIAAIFQSITTMMPDNPMTVGGFDNRALADLILKSLSKKPEDRFQTGAAMAEAFRASMVQHDFPFPENGKKPAGRNRRKIALGLVVATCLLLGVIAAVYRMTASPVPTAALAVTSQPAGAQVFVNALFKGKTPLDIPLSPGTYEVRLNLPDHYEWEAQISVEDQAPEPLNVRLVPIDG